MSGGLGTSSLLLVFASVCFPADIFILVITTTMPGLWLKSCIPLMSALVGSETNHVIAWKPYTTIV